LIRIAAAKKKLLKNETTQQEVQFQWFDRNCTESDGELAAAQGEEDRDVKREVGDEPDEADHNSEECPKAGQKRGGGQNAVKLQTKPQKGTPSYG
jgi:hypothetical protein